MKIRILGAALCLSILLGSLVGCSGNGGTTSGTDSTAGTVSDGAVTGDASTGTESGDVTGDTSDTTGSAASGTASTGTSASSTAGSISKPATTVSKTEKPPETYDIQNAPLPQRNLTNKNLTYFYWADLEKDNKAWHALMKKEYGVNITVKKATFTDYWNTLGMMIRSNNAPDVVEMPNWDMYPRAITDELIQPLDDILDLNSGLWNETRDIMEKYKWNGKTYLTFLKSDMYSWCYYNEKMMKNYGITKTPKELFLEDNWTLEELKKIADQFVNKSKGTFGFTMQNWNLQAITGVSLVETDATNGYKLNLKNEKIATLWNWMHSVGKAGSGAYVINDAVGDFANQKCPIYIGVTNLFVDSRCDKIRDDIEWVPLPKMDKNSSYYLEMCEAPNLAIAKGAKNVEGAALALEFRRWLYLGRVQTSDFLEPKTNAATKRYKLNVFSNYDNLDKDEVEWTKQILSMYDYKYADISWGSWINTNGQWSHWPGCTEVINEGKAWSTIVDKYYNQLDAQLKALIDG